MATWRTFLVVVGLLAAATAARAQTVALAEFPQPGSCNHYLLALQVSGELKVQQGDQPLTLKLAAAAAHQFDEKLLAVSDKGIPQKAARAYARATAGVTVNGENRQKTLRPERALAVAQRNGGQFLTYSPQGPLTPDELDVIGDHFDTLAVIGLLPGKPVAVGDTWKLDNDTTLALCSFDALISQDLTGKLVETKDGTAVFAISGTAKGIEKGALVTVSVTATGRFDLAAQRLVAVDWKEKDEREQGPASPAGVLESTCTVTRTSIAEPKELAAPELVGIPAGFDVPAALTNLSVRDGAGRVEFAFGRDWSVVAQTDDHTVLRLLERGDFLAQATVTPWKKAEPGKHLAADEFEKLLLGSPGFEMEDIEKPAETTENGRTVVRQAAVGAMDGVKVMQCYYLIVDPNGEQAIVALVMKPQSIAKVAGRDLALVQSVVFPAKK